MLARQSTLGVDDHRRQFQTTPSSASMPRVRKQSQQRLNVGLAMPISRSPAHRQHRDYSIVDKSPRRSVHGDAGLLWILTSQAPARYGSSPAHYAACGWRDGSVVAVSPDDLGVSLRSIEEELR